MTGLDSVRWPRHTARLELRRATPADVATIAAIRAKPGVSEWLSSGGSPAAIAAHLARAPRLAAALVIAADGDIIGDAMIAIGDAWAQNEVSDRAAGCQAELGWVLDPAHGGRGLATEAVADLLAIAFDELGVHRVVAECFADNESSWRLMERVGMRRETHSIRDGLHRSGRWLDGYTYAMLADEWQTATGDR